MFWLIRPMFSTVWSLSWPVFLIFLSVWSKFWLSVPYSDLSDPSLDLTYPCSDFSDRRFDLSNSYFTSDPCFDLSDPGFESSDPCFDLSGPCFVLCCRRRRVEWAACVADSAGPGLVGHSRGHLPRVVQSDTDQHGVRAPTSPSPPLTSQGRGGRLAPTEVHG